MLNQTLDYECGAHSLDGVTTISRTASTSVDAASAVSRFRSEITAFVVTVGIGVAAACFAHYFKASIGFMVEHLHGARDPIVAAGMTAPMVVLVAVGAVVSFAVIAGRYAARRGRAGLHDVAAATRGEREGPPLSSALTRSLGTWAASVGLTSIGRESAIIESSGALGEVAGRRVRLGPGAAAAGVAAGFAAAYHAPIAGALYVEEHLGVRHSRRAMMATVIGAVVGHLVTLRLFHGTAIFPSTQGSRWSMALLGLVALVPSVFAARLFLEVRERLTASAVHRRSRLGAPAAMAPFVLAAAAMVAFVPLTAGNGMELLRHASSHAVLPVALAMALAKFVASAGALGSGAPGGALSPTMAIAAGWALLVFVALDGVGVALPGTRWDGMIMAMTIGIAVGIRAPLVAIFMIPEMLGDLTLVPLCAVVVGAAMVLDHGIDRVRIRHGRRLPDRVDDADA